MHFSCLKKVPFFHLGLAVGISALFVLGSCSLDPTKSSTSSTGISTNIVTNLQALATPIYLTQYGAGGGLPGPLAGQFTNCSDLCFDNEGNMYVSDSGAYRIQKFDGTTWSLLINNGKGAGTGFFNYSGQIAFFGNLYVADISNRRLQMFNASTGAYIVSIGSAGGTDGLFQYPWGMSIDRSGNIYVSDTENSRIQRFGFYSSAYAFLQKWGSGGTSGRFFFTNTFSAIDGQNYLWICDTGNHRLVCYDFYSNYVMEVAPGKGTSVGQFNAPYGVACHPSAPFQIIADSGNNRFYVMDWSSMTATMTQATKAVAGSAGTGNLQFSSPRGVRFDPTGTNILICDYGNHRIQKINVLKTVVSTNVVTNI